MFVPIPVPIVTVGADVYALPVVLKATELGFILVPERPIVAAA